MLRLIHAFDLRPGVDEQSFINWLDAALWEQSKRFGCLERKTWLFLDGIQGTYDPGQSQPVGRPRFLNEAFWPHQEAAEAFRAWLISPAARPFRERMFGGIANHSVLRYIEFGAPGLTSEE